jgi:hypothetical protein
MILYYFLPIGNVFADFAKDGDLGSNRTINPDIQTWMQIITKLFLKRNILIIQINRMIFVN